MHTTISSGQVFYRTRLISLGAARSFAQCLDRNKRFTSVSIRLSKQQPDRYFVVYRPASQKRSEAITQEQQDQRSERANVQGSQFRFAMIGPGLYRCHSARSGSDYTVSIAECTCGDHTSRCRRAGLRCKHRIALATWLGGATAQAA